MSQALGFPRARLPFFPFLSLKFLYFKQKVEADAHRASSQTPKGRQREASESSQPGTGLGYLLLTGNYIPGLVPGELPRRLQRTAMFSIFSLTARALPLPAPPAPRSNMCKQLSPFVFSRGLGGNDIAILAPHGRAAPLWEPGPRFFQSWRSWDLPSRPQPEALPVGPVPAAGSPNPAVPHGTPPFGPQIERRGVPPSERRVTPSSGSAWVEPGGCEGGELLVREGPAQTRMPPTLVWVEGQAGIFQRFLPGRSHLPCA